jgi:hypothetical protein
MYASGQPCTSEALRFPAYVGKTGLGENEKRHEHGLRSLPTGANFQLTAEIPIRQLSEKFTRQCRFGGNGRLELPSNLPPVDRTGLGTPALRPNVRPTPARRTQCVGNSLAGAAWFNRSCLQMVEITTTQW